MIQGFVRRRHWLVAMGAGAIGMTSQFAALGQSNRARVTTIVVPFAPGGSIDVAVRVVATEMEKLLGVTVVVDNRVGGSAIIASEFVARKPADGATLLVGSNSSLVNNTAMFDKLPYDPAKDFAAVGLLGRSSLLISARAEAPFTTVGELVSRAKADPDKISRGSSGIGNITNVAMLRLERELGLRFIHVPYAGEAQSMQALLGGTIDVQLGSVSATTVGHISSGRVRPLALMGPARHPMLPNVLTMEEAGFRDALGVSWFTLMVPTGTPAEVVKDLNRALNTALQVKGVGERVLQAGIEPLGGSPDDAERLIASERKLWVPFLRQAGIKA